jgi:hypothetical protein
MEPGFQRSNGDNGEKPPENDANARQCMPRRAVANPRRTTRDTERQTVPDGAVKMSRNKLVSSRFKFVQVVSRLCKSFHKRGGCGKNVKS